MSPAVVVIFVYLMVQIRTSTCLTQVEIACPIFTSTFGGNGALPFHGPAFEAAVKECNRIYAGVFNFTITFITAATVEETIDNFAGNIARWHFDPKRSSDIDAIISPGSMDPTLIHQLTSHWNILCLSTTVARKSEYNLRPATTMIAATFVSLPSIATTLTTLLSSHGWITVFLVIDRGSTPAYYSIADELDRTNKTVPRIRYLKRNIVAKNL
ncbi:hypothetical protein BV898_11234 [Hypsibius exemplaris]|uniref:Receptor ligand binding region domain-containing protein n=1 Tax=Hypsibius exemplaris TaxID=2072580 RepID=A0A1W0WH58_HYPEX|nr:hypothetical protein BV898_11234 [Hypsibius exemplaris]